MNLYLFRLPIMKELVKRGHKVYAVCPKEEVFDKIKNFGIEAVDYDIKRSFLNPLNEIKTIIEIKKVIKNIKPDILHTFMHKPNIYGNLTGVSNIINTITGLGSFFVYNDFKSKFIRSAILNLYKISSKNSKRVIFQNSDYMRFFIDRRVIPQKKATLVKSIGIDTDDFNPMLKDGKLLKELNLDEKKPIVLMIARVIKDKGVKEYIEAADGLKDRAILLYAGDLDRGNKNAFNPDWKSVKYLGFRRDIKELISICDIFVSCSESEGFPNVIVEAMICGIPVVSSNCISGPREILAPNTDFNIQLKESIEKAEYGILYLVGNIDKLTEDIQLLLNNDKLKKEYIKKAQKRANDFSIEKIIKNYKKVVEND